MKKKYVLLTTGLLILALAAGCGSKAGQTTDNAKQEASQTTITDSEKAKAADETEKTDATEAPESTETNAEVSTEEKTLTGTIEEVKDFMFIVTDESGASYEFSFDEKPEGLDAVTTGDKVQVTYTGEISEVDPFNGTVISVEK